MSENKELTITDKDITENLFLLKDTIKKLNETITYIRERERKIEERFGGK